MNKYFLHSSIARMIVSVLLLTSLSCKTNENGSNFIGKWAWLNKEISKADEDYWSNTRYNDSQGPKRAETIIINQFGDNYTCIFETSYFNPRFKNKTYTSSPITAVYNKESKVLLINGEPCIINSKGNTISYESRIYNKE